MGLAQKVAAIFLDLASAGNGAQRQRQPRGR